MTKQKLREALNKLDHKALDECTEYYDLVNSFDAIKDKLNESIQVKIEALIKSNKLSDLDKLMSNMMLGEDLEQDSKKQILNESCHKSKKATNIDEASLDEIYEEELNEGRNDLEPVKCKALASGKPYYALFDTKTHNLAKYRARYRYETKEQAQDAINDKDNDLGFGKDEDKYRKTANGELIDEALLTEGEITKGPFEVKIYYDHSKGKYRAQADDGIHGLANCRFPVELRDKDCIYIVSQLDWLGNQYNVPQKVIIGEKSELASKDMEKAGVKFDDASAEFSDNFFEGLNEEENTDDSEFIPSDISYEFGDVTFSEDDVSPEMLQMIKKPLKANGEPFAETIAILRIYDHLINHGERSVTREQILKESGVANWNRQGEHSTWFTELGILGLINLSDNDIYAGPNLSGWVEGTIQPIGTWHHRDGSTSSIGPGNIQGMDLRPLINTKTLTVNARADQGLQPDRSHGKGDTKTIDTQLKSSGIKFDGSIAEFPDEFFEELKEEIPTRDSVIKDRTAKINKLYRKYMSLEEDAEVTEETINDWGVGHVCSMNGWDEDCVRNALLHK